MVTAPAYEQTHERVLVKEASERLQVIPAQYETIEEKLLVRPAFTSWKKNRGPIEQVDHMTGEIMCLVETPAQYETVRTQKLVSKASTQKIAIPAVYKDVHIRKIVTAASEQRVEIPATYKNVTERHMVSEGQLDWQAILCETNTTVGTVRKLQRALAAKGYNPGNIDGVVGSQTMRAVTRYQTENALPSGKLTIETLQRLNVIAAS